MDTSAMAEAADTCRPSDDELRVRFPAHDFDGYWFFGGLHGDGPFDAVMFGLGVGANDGYDWGFEDVQGDPDFGQMVFQMIGADGSVGANRQPIHRHEFAYDRRRMDVRVGGNIAVSMIDGTLRADLVSDDGARELHLVGQLPDHAYWTPDMIFRRTAFVSVAMPGIAFSGTFRDGDVTHTFSGIGTLDHPMGTLRHSVISRGMGWWEYNCMMIDQQFGLFQWFIIDGHGNQMLAAIATDYPDHRLHVGSLDLTYTEWQDRATQMVPTRWHVDAVMDHGSFEYEIVAGGAPWDGAPHVRGQPLPNFVLRLDGSFTPTGQRPTAVRGVGTGETVISERDPYHASRQLPW
jgi:hypothetical protein